MLVDISIILLLILLNGVLAMTELAVVSSRGARLAAKAEAGSKGAKVALELKEDHGKFLSTVQIGITLIGIFSGAFSGVTLAEPLGDYFIESFPSLGAHADDIAIGLVVTGVTYLSLVIGELVPKQIALRFADDAAILISRPIRWLAILTKPIVVVLDISNRLVLMLLGVKPDAGQTTSQEDVKAAIAEGTAAGVVGKQEQRMLESVMNLNAVPVRATMTHRQDIVWFDVNESIDSIIAKIEEHKHSNYPLREGSNDHIIGMVSTKDLVVKLRKKSIPNLRVIAMQPLTLPENTTVSTALEKFRTSKVHVAVIVDEYGSLEGIVTLKDIMEAIVGIMPDHADDSYNITKREDGCWLIDGRVPVYEVESALGFKDMQEDNSSYNTLAGFILHHLGHLPKEGDNIFWQDCRFEVIDMDGKRIDKVLVHEKAMKS